MNVRSASSPSTRIRTPFEKTYTPIIRHEPELGKPAQISSTLCRSGRRKKDPNEHYLVRVFLDCRQEGSDLADMLGSGPNLNPDIIQIGVGVPVAIKVILIEEGENDSLSCIG